MPTPIFKSRAMVKAETALGRSLEAFFEDRYQTATQEQIASELGVSTATVSRWMRELGIETRLPNQRPPTPAPVA